MATESIAVHVKSSLGLLYRLIKEAESHDSISSRHVANNWDGRILLRIKDEQTRFRVWAGNLGAHRTGMASLDYRLRDASHIGNQVVRLLKDLERLLRDALAIIKGEAVPWDQLDDDAEEEAADDEDEDSPRTELEQISFDIVDVVNCLYRLSVTIRNPAPHDRFMNSRYTDSLTPYFEPYDISHVQSKFGSIEPWLADRLGKAISMRRQYFKYRASHHSKLAYRIEYYGTADVEIDAPETIASSIPDEIKENSGGNLPIPDDYMSDGGASQTSHATSFADDGEFRIPPLPDEAYDGPFQCPFCYMIISADTRPAWKKHVYSDLRPYTCLVKDCITPEREFEKRRQWIDHTVQDHWSVYTCPQGCGQDFSSVSDCKEHLSKKHPGSISAVDVDARIHLMLKPVSNRSLACPLCQEVLDSSKQYESHVGRHQRQLSLFALPNIASHDERSQEDGDSANSNSIDIEGEQTLDELIASALAEENARGEKKSPIKFKDAVGREYSFPFRLCQTWDGMEKLIFTGFDHMEALGPHVRKGYYHLIGPNGEIILPAVWDKVIEPGWDITMTMWPMDQRPWLPPRPSRLREPVE